MYSISFRISDKMGDDIYENNYLAVSENLNIEIFSVVRN